VRQHPAMAANPLSTHPMYKAESVPELVSGTFPWKSLQIPTKLPQA
jgi:hypothetical protein